MGSSSVRDWIEFDVTELVRAIADGAPNNGFMVGLVTILRRAACKAPRLSGHGLAAVPLAGGGGWRQRS